MSFEPNGRVGHLVGALTVEDAEPLLAWCAEQVQPKLNARRLTHLHTACLQVILAVAPRFTALPADAGLRTLLTTPAGTPIDGRPGAAV